MMCASPAAQFAMWPPAEGWMPAGWRLCRKEEEDGVGELMVSEARSEGLLSQDKPAACGQ